MNKMILQSVMGTVDMCPYAPRSKMIAAEVGAAGVTALGGLIGSALGFGSSKSANQTNLQIARENNQAQREMFHEQMAYNTDMWNKQNQYNLPANQVQRLLAAGINPAAVFGNGTMSEAGQLTAPNAPQLQQAHVNPYQPDLKVGDAVNAYMQSQLANAQRKKDEAETRHTEQQNMFDMEANVHRLKSLEALAKRDDALGNIAKEEMLYQQQITNLRVKQLRNDLRAQDQQYRLSEQQILNHQLQNKMAEIQVAYLPRMNDAQIAHYYASVKQLVAQIGLIKANTTLTNAQRNTEIERATGEFYKNAGLDYDAQIKGAIKDAVIGTTNLEYENYPSDRFHRIFQGYLGAANNAMQGGSSAAALKILLGK